MCRAVAAQRSGLCSVSLTCIGMDSAYAGTPHAPPCRHTLVSMYVHMCVYVCACVCRQVLSPSLTLLFIRRSPRLLTPPQLPGPTRWGTEVLPISVRQAIRAQPDSLATPAAMSVQERVQPTVVAATEHVGACGAPVAEHEAVFDRELEGGARTLNGMDGHRLITYTASKSNHEIR